jgi:predicted dehydrogenase
MKPLGLAFVGLHHQHPRWYFPLWAHLPEYQPLAICDADEAFLKSENAFFKLDAYSDYGRVLDRKDVDVVLLWLPHSMMPAAVEAAAAAGKHVIVEKPCAANLAGARQIVDIARRYPQIKIASPYCWRTHQATGYIRSAINAGLLGEITAMEARLNAGGAWRYVRDNALWMLTSAEGGGPMWNLGVHWVDYFRHLTHQEVVSVYGAVGGPAGQPSRDIEDNAQAVLKFSGGAIAILDISYGLTDSHPGKRDIYVSLRGQLGDIQWAPAWQGTKDEVLIVSESAAASEKCRRIEVISKDIPGYCGQMAWQFLRDFAAGVNDSRQNAAPSQTPSVPLAGPADILAAVEVVDAFYRSVRSGKAEGVARS